MPPLNNNALPYNLEAEQSVLGAILIDMESQFEIVSKLNESDFCLESHKLIFASMYAICAANKPVDVVTLSDDMEKKATLEKAGGIEYVTELARTTPSAANYQYYLDIVKRDGTLRKLIKSAEAIIKDAQGSSDRMRSVAFAEKSAEMSISDRRTKLTKRSKENSTNFLIDYSAEKYKNHRQGVRKLRCNRIRVKRHSY